MTAIALTFLFINTIHFLDRLYGYIYELRNEAFVAAINFMNEIVLNAETYDNKEVTNQDLDLFYQASKYMKSVLLHLAQSVRVSFMITASIALATLIASILDLLYDFRRRIMRARMGNHDYNLQAVQISESISYAGLQISNGILVYLTIMVLFGLFLFVFVWDPSREAIWQYRATIFALLLTKLITMISLMVLRKILAGRDYIRNRGAYQLTELVFLFLAVWSGIIDAVVRLLLWFFISLFALARMTHCLFPAWIFAIMNLDRGNRTYLASVQIYHVHNHPVMLTFMDILKETMRLRELQSTYLSENEKNAAEPRLEDFSSDEDDEVVDDVMSPIQSERTPSVEEGLPKRQSTLSLPPIKRPKPEKIKTDAKLDAKNNDEDNTITTAPSLLLPLNDIDLETDELAEVEQSAILKNRFRTSHNRRVRIINRFHLYILLSRNPHLIKFRKHNLKTIQRLFKETAAFAKLSSDPVFTSGVADVYRATPDSFSTLPIHYQHDLGEVALTQDRIEDEERQQNCEVYQKRQRATKIRALKFGLATQQFRRGKLPVLALEVETSDKEEKEKNISKTKQP
eukprot:CAMPEP_0114985206 /NCGR_PEP_ID=MMETSP0216-20121206/7721_1 /TAXON_ID=223996 /ORGANISM="Protocruzia adherens, Strain Boccale" /LENGTH=571 /DNA_ID=CAMNT_0002347463 /DNA_START=495 /DNA_END=2210 /DNA_ORIENTATION=+